METAMKDHVAPAMHQHNMSMFERNMASARNRNMTPEHLNPESLIPSNLFDSLPQQPLSPPRYTYSSPRSVTTESHSTSTPYPHNAPCLFSPQPPPQELSGLLALSRHQQWLYCTPEQADRWKPRKNEIEYLNHKPREHIHFASSHAADGEEVDEDSAGSEWEECHREGEEEAKEAEEAEETEETEDVDVDDEKEEQGQQQQQQQLPTPPRPHQHPQAGQIPSFLSIHHHNTSNAQNPSTLQTRKKKKNNNGRINPTPILPLSTPKPAKPPPSSQTFLTLIPQTLKTPPTLQQHIPAISTPNPAIASYPRPGTLHYNATDPQTPSVLYYLDYRLLEIQRQHYAAGETYGA